MNLITLTSIAYLLSWLLFVVALFIVPGNRRPGEATAWLMLIFLLPFLGFLLFLILGSPKLSRQRRAMQRTMSETLVKNIEQFRQHPELANMSELLDPPIPARYEPFVRLNQQLGGMPAFGGNTVELLPGYQLAVDRIVEDIDRAQKYVHVEYFMFADDATGSPVIDALIRAQERGVACQVLWDHLSNIEFRKPALARLAAGGVEVHEMLPVKIFDREWSRMDLRNHRKILVVDGRAAFSGSQNLIEPCYDKPKNQKLGRAWSS